MNDAIKPTYFKALLAAFGSALITSIYGVVDMAVVGQYQGAEGTAALATVAPIWNIIYSLGLLMGIGGSVLFSTLRGQHASDRKRSNAYFTSSLIGLIILSLISWAGILLFQEPLLALFGADATLMPLAKAYLYPIQFGIPTYLFSQFLAAYLRNDGNPALATKAVLFGGFFNVFGDLFFVFTLDMGIMGAGLATQLGSLFSTLIMAMHFFSKKNTLALTRPTHLLHQLKLISITGFPTFLIDIAMGVLTMLFNRQIMKYLGQDALSVYGVLINLSTFVQCCAYSIGQASQPIISMNHGAHHQERIREVVKYAIYTAIFFGVVWTSIKWLIPDQLIMLFMKPSQTILQIAPAILGIYGISFLWRPYNVFSTYYFQAVMESKVSLLISVLRGIVLSGALILLLPALFSPESIWWVMPITELCTCVIALLFMEKSFSQ